MKTEDIQNGEKSNKYGFDIFILPVDILFVYVGSVNNMMRDGLICHIVCAPHANRLVPGHFTTKTPEIEQYTKKYTKREIYQFKVCLYGINNK